MQHNVALDTRSAQSDTVLNAALLDQYRSRKSNLLERLITAYLDEAPKFFQNIRKAVETSDFAAARMNAHALKSCSYNLGAVRLSKVCQELETAAGGGNMAGVADLMHRMGPECFEVEEALKSQLFDLNNAKPKAP